MRQEAESVSGHGLVHPRAQGGLCKYLLLVLIWFCSPYNLPDDKENDFSYMCNIRPHMDISCKFMLLQCSMGIFCCNHRNENDCTEERHLFI